MENKVYQKAKQIVKHTMIKLGLIERTYHSLDHFNTTLRKLR